MASLSALAPPVHFKVGTEWGGAKEVFSGGGQIIYTVQADGRLIWYRHTAQSTREFGWQGPIQISSTWGKFTHTFSGGNGILFGLHENGNLYRYHHTGWATGAPTFANPDPSPVGTGWGGFSKVFGWGVGNVYGIDAAGDLLYYRFNAQGGLELGPVKVGNGWGGFREVFAAPETGIIFGVNAEKEIRSYQHVNSQSADGGRIDAMVGVLRLGTDRSRWFAVTSPLAPSGTAYWWEGATVHFHTTSRHPKDWQTIWSYYLLAHDSGAFTGDAEGPAPGTAFRIERVESLGPRKARVRLKTRLDRYLIALEGGGVMANSTNPGAWETLEIEGGGVESPGGALRFKSWRGFYLKQDFIHNEMVGIPFRSTPGVPMADYNGTEYFATTVFSSSAAWYIQSQ